MNLRSIRKLFARSPDTHRSVLFWHWPTALPPKTVEREMDDILANGIGGVLIDSPPSSHAADYLNDDWLTALSAATSRARKRHDSVWIFDDLASKNSPAKAKRQKLLPEHAESYLQYERWIARDDIVTRLQEDPPYAVFVNDEDGERQIDHEEWEALAGTQRSLHCFYHRRSEIHLRYLHAESVRDYLDQTYGPIRQKTKRFFGNTLGVILANNAELHTDTDIIPWDEDLPDIFEQAHGYALIPFLPLLMKESSSNIHAPVHYHFWTLIADLFREGLSHTLQTWGEENKIPTCGYFPSNFNYVGMTNSTGPRMPHYALQTFPTVKLGMSYPYIELHIELLQAKSVRRQLGTRGVIGVYDYDQEPCSLPKLIDAFYRHIAIGATYITFEGFHDNSEEPFDPLSNDMRTGILDIDMQLKNREDENEAPTTLKTLQPYLTPGDTAWPWTKTHFDRLARLTWIHALGTPHCEVLLLQPDSSIQAESFHSETIDHLNEYLRDLTSLLLENQIDFDFGDEYLLSLYGRAEHNRIVIKEANYSVVVIPPMTNLRRSTLALLQDFAMSGGNMLCIGTIPEMLDGVPSPDLSPFFDQYARRITNGIDLKVYNGVVEQLKKWNTQTVSITGRLSKFIASRSTLEELELIHLTREMGGDRPVRVEFTVETEGHIEFWNHIDGTMTPICPCSPDEPVVIEDTWQWTEARTYVAIPEPMPENFEPEAPLTVERTLEPDWTATREHGIPHMLTTCRFAGHAWGNRTDAQENLRERLAANPDGIIGHLQWRLPDDAFDSDLDHELVLVAPDNVTVTLNHETLESLSDPAINLPGFTGYALPAEPGTLQIEGKFRHAELLSAPIIIPKAKRDPDFGEVDSIPVALQPWNRQGLEGFAHTVTYRTEIQGYERFDDAPIYLECEYLHSPAEVRINDEVAGHLIWEPFRLDIRPWWSAGPLNIELEVAGTWANVFHPENRLPFQGLDTPPKITIHAHTSRD